MMIGLTVGLLAIVGFAVGALVPPLGDRLRRGGRERELREAVDDLWGCIAREQILDLQPETVALAKANHEKVSH